MLRKGYRNHRDERQPETFLQRSFHFPEFHRASNIQQSRSIAQARTRKQYVDETLSIAF